jgi:hypothetical protein
MYNNDFLNLSDVMQFRKNRSYPKILSLYFFIFKWLVKFILWLNFTITHLLCYWLLLCATGSSLVTISTEGLR